MPEGKTGGAEEAGREEQEGGEGKKKPLVAVPFQRI